MKPFILCSTMTFVGVLTLPIQAALPALEVTVVDPQATMYGTFQSHCQKVLCNDRGIFMTHVRTRNEDYTAQQWRLSRSVDGGKSFVTVYEETSATHPPVIETDAASNVYLFRTDFAENRAYFYRFLAAEDFGKPHLTPIAVAAPGKYAAYSDRRREQIYFAPQSHAPFVARYDGTVAPSKVVLKAGANAIMQYPQLSMEAGVLYEAWTSAKPGRFDYWDIHAMKSADGGESWSRLDGLPLPPPIILDDTGPTDRITLDDEFVPSTFLSNFIVRDGKAHFVYLATTDPPRQHYVRVDAKTGKREIDLQPHFKGEAIELYGLDGFFAADAKRLYFVGHATGGRIGCLASDDNGASWHDRALSDPMPGLYAIGGCRDLTPAGDVIGSCTTMADPKIPGSTPRVYFLAIRNQ